MMNNIFGSLQTFYNAYKNAIIQLIAVAGLLYVIVYISMRWPDNVFFEAIIPILIALFSAVSISLMIHLGLILDTRSISEKLEETVKTLIGENSKSFSEKMTESVEEIKSAIKNDNQKLDEDIQEKINLLRRDFSGKINEVSTKIDAKYIFGLDSVEREIDESKLIENISNSKIFWMNTKFYQANRSMQAIHSAISRGNKIRLLLMSEESHHIAYRSLYTSDFFDDPKKSVEDYNDYLKTLKAAHMHVRKEFSRIEDNFRQEGLWDDNDPIVELRFYADPAGMPMFLIEDKKGSRECYSGFYLNSFSREMPYLRWYGSDKQMVENLFDYFEKKWYFASDKFIGFPAFLEEVNGNIHST